MSDSAPVADPVTLEALDFPMVLAALAGQAQTPMGHGRLKKLTPIADRPRIEARQAEVAEFRQFMMRGGGLSLAPARPVEAALRAAMVEGFVLDFNDMVAVYRTAQVGEAVRRRLAGVDELRLLTALGAGMPDLSALVDQIERVFDKDGEVRDSASPQLAALRRKKRKLKARLMESLERLVHQDNLDGVLRDRLVTQRAGRYVVPVRSGRRGALPGVVHDVSGSGQTIYVEPLESLDQQNAVIEADHAERQEVQRLLADLTGHVRAASRALGTVEDVIGELDVRQAIARFADLAGGVRPKFTAGELLLKGVCHPLMIPAVARLSDDPLALDAGDGAGGAGGSGSGADGGSGADRGRAVAGGRGGEPSEPVPLDLELPAETRSLVITGPNTGGKTVVLKAVGLAVALAQSGVPVPGTQVELPCCPRLHADIGDEQSIIANLSTFSAHLTRIKRFLDDSPPQSLVLLDELGTGTDPAEGAALGIAVLDHLAEMETTTIASTHHDALKAYAHNAPAALNAAMEFSSETLQPTFRLRVGLPGRSNAFDIAERLGLDAGLVTRARGLIGRDTAQLDSLIRSVEDEAESLASDREGVQKQQNRLAEAHKRYEKLNRRLAEMREELAAEGKAAADEALRTVRAAGEAMLEELSRELGEARKSRAAQDRRATWAAKVGAAEATARRGLQRTVDAAATALTAAHEGAASQQGAPGGWGEAGRQGDAGWTGDGDWRGGAGGAAGDGRPGDAGIPGGEPLDETPDTPLERGEAVVVMPLNLRGKVARDWAGEGDGGDQVEVDVHGKRLIVSRQQVRRLGG